MKEQQEKVDLRAKTIERFSTVRVKRTLRTGRTSWFNISTRTSIFNSHGNGGITLIALIVTIVVLLILAGISISMIAGNNGILNKAIEVKEITEEAEKNEENILNSYEDIINEYTGIDWDTVLANAEMHPDQKISTVIGVGTDGRPVNMDLWEYTLLDNDTFALNDQEVIENAETIKNSGYKFGNNGENVIDGKIIGTIPQYISTDNGTTYKPVTDLTCTFSENNYLVYAPYIPPTVTNMNATFIRCNNLTTVENLPKNLQNLGGAFKQTAIISMPYLPDTITNLSQTFYGCTNLTQIINIPKNSIDISQTFEGCTSLKNIDVKIPNTVINMVRTFADCTALSGTIEIVANITDISEEANGFLGNIPSTNDELILLCSENIYNLFYDSTRINNIAQPIASQYSNIILKQI